ncbi:MAG: hypothetical protein ABH835_01780 [Patescibacteria group bacterium]
MAANAGTHEGEDTMTATATALKIVEPSLADPTHDTMESVYAAKAAEHPHDFPENEDIRDVIRLFDALPSPF